MSEHDVKGALGRFAERSAEAAAAEGALARTRGAVEEARRSLDEAVRADGEAMVAREGAAVAVEAAYAALEAMNVPRAMAVGYVAMMDAIMAQAGTTAMGAAAVGAAAVPVTAAAAQPVTAPLPPPVAAAGSDSVSVEASGEATGEGLLPPADVPSLADGSAQAQGDVALPPTGEVPATTVSGDVQAPAVPVVEAVSEAVEADLFATVAGPAASEHATVAEVPSPTVASAGSAMADEPVGGAAEPLGTDMPEPIPVEEDDPQFGYDPDWHARRDVPDPEDEPVLPLTAALRPVAPEPEVTVIEPVAAKAPEPPKPHVGRGRVGRVTTRPRQTSVVPDFLSGGSAKEDEPVGDDHIPF